MFILESVILVYFIYVVSYNLFFSLAGIFYRAPRIGEKTVDQKRFGVFIPAYKEDAVIPGVAMKALEQDYPRSKYEVIVIADSLQSSTLEQLSKLPVRLVEVSFTNSTKVKSLNAAFAEVGDALDYAVILDADNVMDTGFLSAVNDLHQQGYSVIQCRRAAKNTDSAVSFLDGLSEEINNHIVGKASKTLALSPGLKGSGMSFNYGLLREELSSMDSVGGFDRELELRILERGERILYAYNVKVLDEKTGRYGDFENQRKRWVSSQFVYLGKYFARGMNMLVRGNLAYFNSSVLRNIQLPRILNLGFLFVLTLITVLLRDFAPFRYELWGALFTANCLSLMIAIPSEYYGTRLLVSVIQLPVVFWKMLRAVLKIKGANRKFIHTPHSTASTNKDKSY